MEKMDIVNFKTEVQRQFNKMKETDLFRVQVDKDLLWEKYLDSFPEGSNNFYKERREYDCTVCKNFIRSVGDMVSIIDGEIVSLWDVKVESYYQDVADSLAKFIKSFPIENKFLHFQKVVGVNKNFKQLESGDVITFEHFYLNLPKNLVKDESVIGSDLANFKTTKEMFKRSLDELDLGAVETILDLIDQNSLYRGEEHKFVLESFKELKKDYEKLSNENDKELFCWSKVNSTPQSVSRIRNTVIGSLLVDLSEGKDLEDAVGSFEAKVAPTNYNRPTSLVTKAMIDNAKKKIDELGFSSSLERRYATLEDITINNILFADREAKKRIDNIFDELSSKVPDKVQNLDKIEEVSIDNFINKILPKADSLEIMFENKHINNLVSLIAPVDLTSKNMFKWDNNFSWSYNGEFTDSIKERVKKQGGKVDADLRCSLSWFNYDDLDLHMKEPHNYEIYFSNKGRPSPSGGTLDVDMNAGNGSSREAVENIVYPKRSSMRAGRYILQVNNFVKRESIDVGFDVEIEFDGIIHNFSYPKPVAHKETITVAEIEYNKNEFKIINSIPSSTSQVVKEAWGISTQSFQKVSVVMLSPNHWDEKAVGNKHYFFMLENCVNDGKARGFFNEFLNEELNSHRKVLEIVGAKMKTNESNNQLSGLGFSSTQRNSLLCKVKGSFSRIIKIVF
ncbi:MAG: hypothetical protein U0354_00160 [Candidatus Sericytochromatia bacterium]